MAVSDRVSEAHSPIRLLSYPNVLFNRYRLVIMLELFYAGGAIKFSTLSKDLNTTDGAIATHVRKLEKEGLIKASKESVDSRKQTVFLITENGIRTLEGLFADLSRIGVDLK